jgi:catechol 2,3-dioxygenase-like lactoylglutathione lyase family enzyme
MDLNLVTIPAQDLAVSARFYRRMGFTQIVDTPHYARFQCPTGTATFSLHLAEPGGGNSGVVVYFETEDLDARAAELRQNGFRFLSDPQDQFWLWREARLKDPSGNELCLYHAGENRINPPWRVNITEPAS